MSTLQNTDLFAVHRGTKTYKVNYKDILAGVTLPNALEYKGIADPTQPMPSPTGGLKVGMVYVLSPSGTIHASWTGVAGLAALDGQLALWEGKKWELMGENGFAQPDAAETVKGIAEIATTAEVNAGTDDQRIVTPAKLQAFVTDQLKATWLPGDHIDAGGIGTSTWNGPADTLVATGGVEVKIAAGAWGAGGAVAPADQVQVRWIASAVAAAAHAATLTGRVENASGSVGVDYNVTLDKLPASDITINAKPGAAAGAVSASDSSTAVHGINAPARLWLNSSNGTKPEVSIAGGAWTAVPTTADAGLAVAPGETFKLRHTTKAGANTVTTTTVRVGWDAGHSVTASYVSTNAATKAPDVGAVTLADVASGDRFTSVAFPVSATMTEDGIPASAKKLKAYVEGTLKSAVQTSAITSIGTPPGVVGDYCTFDPLALSKAGNVSWTLANGNLDAHDPEDCYGVVPGTVCVSSGKYYWELTFAGGSTGATDYWGIERCDNTAVKRYPGNYENSYWFKSSGHKISGTGSEIAYGSKFVLADKAGVAFDADNGTLTFYKNGTSLGTAFTGIDTSKPWRLVIGNYANVASITTWTLNAGQRPFAYPAPSGFKPLTKPLDKVLTFADNTGLASFAPNDAVTEVGNGDNGTGTVKSVNAAGNTLTLNGSPAGWDVGSAVKGPLKTQVITPKTSAITNVAGNVLTLTDNTGLANFRAGDTVTSQTTAAIPVGAIGMDYTGVNQYGAKPWEADCVDRFVTNMAGTTAGTIASGLCSTSAANPCNAADNGYTTTFTAGSNGVTLSLNIYRYGSADIPLTVTGTFTSGPSSLTATVDQTVFSTYVLPPNGHVTFTHRLSHGVVFSKTSTMNGGPLVLVNHVPPQGVISSVGATSLTLASISGTFTTGNYVIGLEKPAANVKLFCKLDAAGAVSDLQSADPGFTAWTPAGAGPYTGTVTFPATLPTGSPTDTDLPAGTTITVEVEATNTAGTDSATSNTLAPA